MQYRHFITPSHLDFTTEIITEEDKASFLMLIFNLFSLCPLCLCGYSGLIVGRSYRIGWKNG